MRGREAYRFNPPSFDYNEEPDYLISSFSQDSFQSAQNVVELFTQAREVCVKVKSCLNDCTGQLDVPRNAYLSTCIAKVNEHLRGRAVQVDYVDTQPGFGRPPQLVIPQQGGISRIVELACNRLNEALRLTFEFANDDKHGTHRYDKTLVASFQRESYYFAEVVPELLKYAEFSDSVKNQADNFLSDFIECYHHTLP